MSRKFKKLSLYILSLLAILSLFLYLSTPAERPPVEGDRKVEHMAKDKEHHVGDGSFTNPWCRDCQRSFLDFLRWQLSPGDFRKEREMDFTLTVERPDFDKLEREGGDYIVWLGHSTVFIKAGGKGILTDPIFWNINFFLRRKTPFPIEPGELPKVDMVFISHGHYDHLNTKSVRFLRDRFDPLFITGPGYGDYFSSLGVTRHMELDWWESTDVEGLRITSLPVQHWSKRGLFDTNRMLWCSFLVEGAGRKYYWVADTGYFRGFGEVGERFGPIDVLLAPIGAYEPRWFMKGHHVNPEEALMVAKDVRARVFIPIHWGTFDLTDEPLWLPMEKVREEYTKESSPVLKVLTHGGHYVPEGEDGEPLSLPEGEKGG